ncbi:hypothetical protein GGR58DRAFT_524679 [Xylaria digitata]|nr:hypothetical protein GGR58DRAFT_524679 [Xylaria digitata]
MSHQVNGWNYSDTDSDIETETNTDTRPQLNGSREVATDGEPGTQQETQPPGTQVDMPPEPRRHMSMRFEHDSGISDFNGPPQPILSRWSAHYLYAKAVLVRGRPGREEILFVRYPERRRPVPRFEDPGSWNLPGCLMMDGHDCLEQLAQEIFNQVSVEIRNFTGLVNEEVIDVTTANGLMKSAHIVAFGTTYEADLTMDEGYRQLGRYVDHHWVTPRDLIDLNFPIQSHELRASLLHFLESRERMARYLWWFS